MSLLTRVQVMVILSLLSVYVESNQPKICRLPSKTGPCKAAIPRFFYDAKSGDCRQFIYGGCDGNANNFGTISECRSACRCTLPLEVGDRSCNARYRRQYYFNAAMGRCTRFRYAGCGGNSNRFGNIRNCRNACAVARCYLPPETGICKAYFQRYYYNSQTESCERFVYGGCRGNSNNFRTQQECDDECRSRILPQPSENSQTQGQEGTGGNESETGSGIPDGPHANCLLPKVVGRCRAAFPRFYYNNRTNSCERFIFGGCRGNANNFKRLTDCQQRCGLTANQSRVVGNQSRSLSITNNGRITTVRPSRVSNTTQQLLDLNTDATTEADCKLPIDTGPCSEHIEYFAFDWSSGQCVSFIYGGCQGNQNRFSDQSTCMLVCEKSWMEKSNASGGAWTRGSIFGAALHRNSVFQVAKPRTQSQNERLVSQENIGLSFYPVPGLKNMKFFPEKKRSKRLIKNPPIDYESNAWFITAIDKQKMISAELAAFRNVVSQLKGHPYLREVCGRGMDRGRCRSRLPMYFFNLKSLRCKRFIYSGCGGNGNVYNTKEECEKTCMKVDPNEEVS
ncbi:kunitz/bovine pancreatic trypsin inhibitor domain protein [Plakobranchus ocellatus]|uniref:Kunitz/bovine pancreatic trypsin inhibitor domain protein n=1 Tax=Plakobranchus ocellatus TaxID=259542 RepID=A0AAV4C8J4_9GAST|nr:kunitz/bovine pancreatic trypsin inhibitor domain protein [Plakobranchus ocellatus]